MLILQLLVYLALSFFFKKAWDAALSPGKNIPMNAFMLWMSGNGVQIFSVMITGMLFFQPIKALMGLDSGKCLN